MRNPRFVTIVFAAAALAAGCAHPGGRTSARSAVPAAQPPVAPPTETAQDEPSLRDASMHLIPELKTVNFDYDSAFIKPDARAVLQANAAWVKEHEGMKVQVTGNCDQRGTVEYNLALGQRRAAAVREYYVHLGVPANRVATISYGKERLLCQESEESCWQRNRRAETLSASPTVAKLR